jgi:hypothetical protein
MGLGAVARKSADRQIVDTHTADFLAGQQPRRILGNVNEIFLECIGAPAPRRIDRLEENPLA